MSYSAGYSSIFSMPFASLEYRDMSDGSSEPEPLLGSPNPKQPGKRRVEIEMTEEELAARIRQERADATAQVEQKLRQEYEQKLVAARAPIVTAVKEFTTQREDYFANVEAEVVKLALSIAAKILHRESQVDPMLVATLVRMAVEKMHEDSRITLRVGTGRGGAWSQYFAGFPNLSRVEVGEDPQLGSFDCVVETELGSANFGLNAQLKEIEQGFFDLLALRPVIR